MKTLIASGNPLAAISNITPPKQDPSRRMYMSGYETYFNELPVLVTGDVLLQAKVDMTRKVIKQLAETLQQHVGSWAVLPQPNGFNRTILGLEEPVKRCDQTYKEGVELIIAQWGDGHTSPVHGHSAGYLHEELLFGRMRVNTYRKVSDNHVRIVETKIVDKGNIATLYTPPVLAAKRDVLIHNFTSIGQSATLHYIPEHTRDGRDNTFEVQYFNDHYGMVSTDVTRITSQQGLYSRIGDVILVRSSNVPEYGDHYIVIVGPNTMKPHGLRPDDKAILAPDGTRLLDNYEMQGGLILLRLNEDARAAFLKFHGIELMEGKVLFAEPNSLTVN